MADDEAHDRRESPLLLNPFTATTSRAERADPRHTSISCQFGMMRSLGSDKERDAAATKPAGVGSCPENGCLLLLGFLTSLGSVCQVMLSLLADGRGRMKNVRLGKCG